jgi:hypothetical protein
MHHVKSALLIIALLALAACSGGAGGCAFGMGSEAPSAAVPPGPRIILNVDDPRPTIDIIDVPENVLTELGTLESREAWTTVFKVAIGPEQLATVGQYSIEGDRVRFTPMFPLDRGRQYRVTFTPPGGAGPVTGTVALPPVDTTPTTVVSELYPTADVLPENQLRLYIQFSAPMSTRGHLDFVHLLDESGQELTDAFLPLNAEFFNEDRTRYTVFLNWSVLRNGAVDDRADGALTEGKYYTLVIDSAWRDGRGVPLREGFHRKFKVGPPDDRPLDPRTWKIAAPAAGTSDPLVVAFPESLDHDLLLRALGVAGPNRKPVDGVTTTGPQETTWSFTPAEPWTKGPHNVVALAILEDLAGNGIGRTFDADNFDRTDDTPEPGRTLIPFTVR